MTNTMAHPTKQGFELVRMAVSVTEVKPGDTILNVDGSLKGSGEVVATVKAGAKWTEIRAAGNHLIARVENWREAEVRRERKTEELRKAETRELMNDMIKSRVEKFQPSSAAILTKMQESVAKGSLISSFDYEALFAAQAEDRIMAQFVNAVERNLGEVTDYVDILAAFKDQLSKQLVEKARYINNRSTSACSNLQADHEVAAIASFIERGAYGF